MAERTRRRRSASGRLTSRDRARLAFIAEALADYYRRFGRDFPWRRGRDPFRAAVAEVLLTKTRAESVVPVIAAVLDAYPTVEHLARAQIADLERLIRPIGLSNKRAQHLSGLAIVLEQRGLEVLSDPETMVASVPGLGIYAASAIAAFVFDQPIGILDANVRRVLDRVFGLRPTDIRSPRSRLRALADALARVALQPKETAYGILDLGATVCLPRPRCRQCPLLPVCRYGSRRVSQA